MLPEKYTNALNALKAQAEGRISEKKDQHQGCEAEAGHIYRIRDGLGYVDLDEDVNVYPSTKNYRLEPHDEYTMPAHEAISMLGQLARMGKLELVTDTIQSLWQRADGTLLQTAFPELKEVKGCIQSGLDLPEEFQKKINEWEALGADEINFDFVEKRQ